MKAPTSERKKLFSFFAAAILLLYAYVLYLAYSISSFIGIVILGTFPIILLYVVLLITWKEKEKPVETAKPIYNKPDFWMEEK